MKESVRDFFVEFTDGRNKNFVGDPRREGDFEIEVTNRENLVNQPKHLEGGEGGSPVLEVLDRVHFAQFNDPDPVSGMAR